MWTRKKYLNLAKASQHRFAADAVRLAWDGKDLNSYRELEAWLGLEPVASDHKSLSDRYHFHLGEASLSLKEHNLLPQIERDDAPSSEPFLPIAVYLDNLRSAHNVGAILRTTEAFRLGSVYFSPSTPYISNPKVQKTSKQTYNLVPTKQISTFDELPHPLIALETAPNAPSIFDFDFPSSFTLLLGNEEYGLSDASLKNADHCVHIPLPGSKNSLNVASAFAIAAAVIRQKIPICLK